MEGFDLISTGVWSIIPPILALALALITKEVYSSLAIGVFTGMVIYQFSLNGAGFEQLVDSFTMVPQMMAEQIAGNGRCFVPCAVGRARSGHCRRGWFARVRRVGGHAYQEREDARSSRRPGIIIFVDDYFNCSRWRSCAP
ncbi:MAG: hypothetical protein ACLVKI_00650 [Gordonibacter urolithinfaciens]